MLNIHGVNYYDASELKKEDPIYFRGCRSVRDIVTKKDIKEEDFKFMMLNKSKGWYVSTSSKAKILLTEKWVLKNVPKYCPDVQNDIKEAPPVLELKDKDKFKDEKGNIIEIEIRGTRDVNNCWFRAKDVEKEFNMPNLRKILEGECTSYSTNVHYAKFARSFVSINEKTTSKKEIFLTLKGMLKVLFGSRTKIADHFTDWATRTLFTIQFGTKENKQKLIADITGVNATSVKEVFKKSCDKFSCVYLFYLGNAKELRDTMNINKDVPDDHIIYKYGRTDDIERRTTEHMNTFSKNNINLKLKLFSYIDPLYVVNAESDISNFFNKYGTHLSYKDAKEIVAVSPKDVEDVKRKYKSLFNEYGGRTKDLQLQMEKLKQTNIILHKDIEMRDKDIEMKNKDIEMRDKDIEMLKKIVEMKDMEFNHLKQVVELEKKVLQQELIMLKTKII